MALGTPRGRLIRQLLTESLLLGCCGGLAGLGVAWALIRIAPPLVPPNAIPVSTPFGLDGMVVLFTLGASLLTSMVFSLAPAIAALRVDLLASLREGGRGSSASPGPRRFRQTMVALQVAIALMLVVSTSLLSQSLNQLTRTAPASICTTF